MASGVILGCDGDNIAGCSFINFFVTAGATDSINAIAIASGKASWATIGRQICARNTRRH